MSNRPVENVLLETLADLQSGSRASRLPLAPYVKDASSDTAEDRQRGRTNLNGWFVGPLFVAGAGVASTDIESWLQNQFPQLPAKFILVSMIVCVGVAAILIAKNSAKLEQLWHLLLFRTRFATHDGQLNPPAS